MIRPADRSLSRVVVSPWLQPIGQTSPAATAIAVYTVLIISRLPEFFSFLIGARLIFILALVTATFAFSLARARLRIVLGAPEMRAVFGILALSIITVPTAVWPGQSLRVALFGFSKTTIFFFLLLYCVRRYCELRRLASAAACCAAVLGLGMVVLGGSGRASVGQTFDANDTAFIMVCLLPIVVMLLVAETGHRRWLVAPVVGLCLVTIIMTKSRGGFLTLVVVALILIAKLPSRKAALKVGIVASGVLVFTFFAPQSYWDRISTIWGGESREVRSDTYLAGGLSSARWEIWKTGVRIMLENPLLGVGIGNFGVAEGMTHKHGKWSAPHNCYTQIGAELGIPGLFLFLYLLYRGVKNCRATARIAQRNGHLRYHLHLAQGIEAGLWGYIVGGMALSHAYTEIVYFLIAVSVLLTWVTVRARAELDRLGSSADDVQTGIPWWKAPR